MWRERDLRGDLEQATLRVRLTATALGATILLLVPGHDHVRAGSTLLGYAAASLGLRAFGARIPSSGWIGVAVDVLFATALSFLLPLSAAWVLYLFAIGIGALRGGVAGLSAATAGAVVSYDLVLAARGGDALASDLWRIQVLLAFAVLAAQLTWAAIRTREERDELRSYSLAQRDLAAAPTPDAMLERLVDHAMRSFGASAAWIADAATVRHARGRADSATAGGAAEQVDLGPDLALHVTFAEDAARSRRVAALRDLAVDTRPLLAAATAREQERLERHTERRVIGAVHRLATESTVAGALAQAVTTAQEIGGASAIVRVATGERLVGDLEADVAAAIARDGVPPRISGAAAAVPAGHGLVLVSLGSRRPLTAADLGAFEILGHATGIALERVTERDALIATATALRGRSEELERGLRERDDAVASAVHELRNPLTSVQAYGQLMSRHLTAVQRQVAQLDSLIEDLLQGRAGSGSRASGAATVDLAQETAEAVARLRVSVPGTEVHVDAGAGPLEARIDAGRMAQVLDNVLRNAAKYSPAGAPVSVTVTRSGDEVRIEVADRGDGIRPEDLERIFDRYARGAQHAGVLPGAGIGLAISREIVTAHGGRIWAESPGLGHGSTFTIALPAAFVPSETARMTNGGAAAR